MSVEVVEYDDAWPARFTAEADQIRAALGPELRRIDHAGSTSVPGLAAKPIIDIALSVESFETLDIEALESLATGTSASTTSCCRTGGTSQSPATTCTSTSRSTRSSSTTCAFATTYARIPRTAMRTAR